MNDGIENNLLSRQRLPLRAVIEIVNGELCFYPIANTDDDERRILDALRFVREDFQG
jgi:hypothetical protein